MSSRSCDPSTALVLHNSSPGKGSPQNSRTTTQNSATATFDSGDASTRAQSFVLPNSGLRKGSSPLNPTAASFSGTTRQRAARREGTQQGSVSEITVDGENTDPGGFHASYGARAASAPGLRRSMNGDSPIIDAQHDWLDAECSRLDDAEPSQSAMAASSEAETDEAEYDEQLMAQYQKLKAENVRLKREWGLDTEAPLTEEFKAQLQQEIDASKRSLLGRLRNKLFRRRSTALELRDPSLPPPTLPSLANSAISDEQLANVQLSDAMLDVCAAMEREAGGPLMLRTRDYAMCTLRLICFHSAAERAESAAAEPAESGYA